MNDLTSPLGFKSPDSGKVRIPVGAIAATLVVALIAGLTVWLVVVNDPLGGEPVAQVRIENSDATVDRNEIATVGVKSEAGKLLPPPDAAEIPADGAQDGVEAADSGAAVDMQSTDGQTSDFRLPVEADPALIEEVAFGPLPKIGADGRKPLDVYARPVPSFVGSSPKIAIVVADLGLSQNATQEALKLLPPEVTLAFAPYGASLDRWAAKARQDGHELLLQVPLEPFDYPDNDPGENTLLVGNDANRNIDSLHNVMARLSTYVGIVNYMGGRFTSEASALEPLMAEVAARGLMYMDDGSSARSLAGQVARKASAAFSRADVVVDSVPAPTEILGRLSQLEQIARTRGLAVGFASARPVTLQQVSDWAKTLDKRGITIVPISAAIEKE